ncbi:MAG TPA: hypothetical protein VM753_14510 [Anaeromyxobacter sp.]|nr:hypothetical protein [Anaeromyxobacter sp.]
MLEPESLPDAPAPGGRPGGPQHERHVTLAIRAFATAAVAYCLTVVAWIATTLTLLPLALRGGPIGRRPAARPRGEPAVEPPAPRALRL